MPVGSPDLEAAAPTNIGPCTLRLLCRGGPRTRTDPLVGSRPREKKASSGPGRPLYDSIGASAPLPFGLGRAASARGHEGAPATPGRHARSRAQGLGPPGVRVAVAARRLSASLCIAPPTCFNTRRSRGSLSSSAGSGPGPATPPRPRSPRVLADASVLVLVEQSTLIPELLKLRHPDHILGDEAAVHEVLVRQ